MSHRGPRVNASPARQMALEVGSIVRLRKAFTHEIIVSHVDKSSLSPEDRAFATRLALGVTSSLGTLDEIIDRFLRSPGDLQPEVRDALRISTYEILFLDKSAHAAVDQGVELAKLVTPKATGLANAVLRKIALAKTDFPFGDPKTDLCALARLHAFPVWLAKLLVADLGYEAACRFMEASNEPAPVFLAINAIKIKEVDALKVFEALKIDAKKVSIPGLAFDGCYRLSDSRVLRHKALLDLFNEGKILVSDAASQMVAHLVMPDSMPSSFLEIGAGRGTKSILLQSDAFRRYGKQMPLQVLDNHEYKIRLLTQRMKVYGVQLDKTYVEDAAKLSGIPGAKKWANIFIDAPCSGLGTLRRHPEIRWRLKPEDISSLAFLGSSLLSEASCFVEPGGMLSYSTCTVVKEENAEVIQAFLMSSNGKQFSLAPIGGRNSFTTALSSGSSDAHFAVRMVRKS